MRVKARTGLPLARLVDPKTNEEKSIVLVVSGVNGLTFNNLWISSIAQNETKLIKYA